MDNNSATVLASLEGLCWDGRSRLTPGEFNQDVRMADTGGIREPSYLFKLEPASVDCRLSVFDFQRLKSNIEYLTLDNRAILYRIITNFPNSSRELELP